MKDSGVFIVIKLWTGTGSSTLLNIIIPASKGAVRHFNKSWENAGCGRGGMTGAVIKTRP
jgi:hypothetical protein